jgi:hypothetical protein
MKEIQQQFQTKLTQLSDSYSLTIQQTNDIKSKFTTIIETINDTIVNMADKVETLDQKLLFTEEEQKKNQKTVEEERMVIQQMIIQLKANVDELLKKEALAVAASVMMNSEEKTEMKPTSDRSDVKKKDPVSPSSPSSSSESYDAAEERQHNRSRESTSSKNQSRGHHHRDSSPPVRSYHQEEDTSRSSRHYSSQSDHHHHRQQEERMQSEARGKKQQQQQHRYSDDEEPQYHSHRRYDEDDDDDQEGNDSSRVRASSHEKSLRLKPSSSPQQPSENKKQTKNKKKQQQDTQDGRQRYSSSLSKNEGYPPRRSSASSFQQPVVEGRSSRYQKKEFDSFASYQDEDERDQTENSSLSTFDNSKRRFPTEEQQEMEMEMEEDTEILYECPGCKKEFPENLYEKHVKICEKAVKGKKKQLDSHNTQTNVIKEGSVNLSDVDPRQNPFLETKRTVDAADVEYTATGRYSNQQKSDKAKHLSNEVLPSSSSKKQYQQQQSHHSTAREENLPSFGNQNNYYSHHSERRNQNYSSADVVLTVEDVTESEGGDREVDNEDQGGEEDDDSKSDSRSSYSKPLPRELQTEKQQHHHHHHHHHPHHQQFDQEDLDSINEYIKLLNSDEGNLFLASHHQQQQQPQQQHRDDTRGFVTSSSLQSHDWSAGEASDDSSYQAARMKQNINHLHRLQQKHQKQQPVNDKDDLRISSESAAIAGIALLNENAVLSATRAQRQLQQQPTNLSPISSFDMRYVTTSNLTEEDDNNAHHHSDANSSLPSIVDYSFGGTDHMRTDNRGTRGSSSVGGNDMSSFPLPNISHHHLIDANNDLSFNMSERQHHSPSSQGQGRKNEAISHDVDERNKNEEKNTEEASFINFHTLIDRINSDILALDLHLVKQQQFEDYLQQQQQPLSSVVNSLFPQLSNENSTSGIAVIHLDTSEEEDRKKVSSSHRLKEIQEEINQLTTTATATTTKPFGISSKLPPIPEKLINLELLNLPSVQPLTSSLLSDSTISTSTSSSSSSLPVNDPPIVSLNDLATISMDELNASLDAYDDSNIQAFSANTSKDIKSLLSAEEKSSPKGNNTNTNNRKVLANFTVTTAEDDSDSDVDSLDEIKMYFVRDLNEMKQTELLKQEDENKEDNDEEEEELDIMLELDKQFQKNEIRKSHSKTPPLVKSMPSITVSSSIYASSSKTVAALEAQTKHHLDESFLKRREEKSFDRQFKEESPSESSPRYDSDYEEEAPVASRSYVSHHHSPPERKEYPSVLEKKRLLDKKEESRRKLKDEEEEADEATAAEISFFDDYENDVEEIKDYLLSDFPTEVYSNSPELRKQHEEKILSIKKKKQDHRQRLLQSLSIESEKTRK